MAGPSCAPRTEMAGGGHVLCPVGDSISAADKLLDSSSRLLSQCFTKNLQAGRGNAWAAA